MKNVTITLPDEVAARARVEAARQAKSLSRFIADLLAERCGRVDDPLAALEGFLSGPGYPGISRNWKGREALYAEREDELLRRYKPSRLQRGSRRADKTTTHGGFAEKGHPQPYAGPKRTKPK
jgi:hypothetical protein